MCFVCVVMDDGRIGAIGSRGRYRTHVRDSEKYRRKDRREKLV